MESGVSSTDPRLAALADAANAVVASVRAGGLAGDDSQRLGTVLQQVRRVQAQLGWVASQVAREVDISGCHVADGALSTAAWLRQKARMSPREARRVACTGRALGTGALDATSAAWRAGEIDDEHAHLIAGFTADAPAGAVALIEPVALDVARDCPPAAVADVMRGFRRALDPDAEDAAAVRRYEQRGLSAAVTLEGMVAGRFLLDSAAGSALLTALDAAEPLRTNDDRSAPQRRADALARLADHFLATGESPRTAGARPHVIVTTTAPHQLQPTLLPVPPHGVPVPPHGVPVPPHGVQVPSHGDGPDPHRMARLSWIGEVGQTTADRVACDASVTVIGLDPDGEVESHGGGRRYFTWAQRRAMIARDGDRCPWPWCDRPVRWSDGHHLRSWQDGGPTTVANGALPCEGHHVLLHEGHWVLERLPDGRYLARHPTGQVLGPEPHRRPRGLDPPPVPG